MRTNTRLASSVITPDPRHLGSCTHCDARPHSVCNAVPAAEMARLAAASTAGVAEPGTCFISEGARADAFFNITAGTARLFKLLPDGRRQIMGFAGVGHFIGLAISETFTFSAEAIDHVHYCRFSRPRLRALLDDFPAMEQKLLEVASSELVAAQDQMLLLGRKTARERLASFLISESRNNAGCYLPRTRFALPMTRGDIADYLGLTIETVSRTLTRLRQEGLIEIPSAGDIIILDRDGLERLAEGLA